MTYVLQPFSLEVSMVTPYRDLGYMNSLHSMSSIHHRFAQTYTSGLTFPATQYNVKQMDTIQ